MARLKAYRIWSLVMPSLLLAPVSVLIPLTTGAAGASVSGGSVLAAHLVLNWNRYCGSPEQFEAAAEEVLDLEQEAELARAFGSGGPDQPTASRGTARWSVTGTGALDRLDRARLDASGVVPIGALGVGWYRIEFLRADGVCVRWTSCAVLARLVAAGEHAADDAFVDIGVADGKLAPGRQLRHRDRRGNGITGRPLTHRPA